MLTTALRLGHVWTIVRGQVYDEDLVYIYRVCCIVIDVRIAMYIIQYR